MDPRSHALLALNEFNHDLLMSGNRARRDPRMRADLGYGGPFFRIEGNQRGEEVNKVFAEKTIWLASAVRFPKDVKLVLSNEIIKLVRFFA